MSVRALFTQLDYIGQAPGDRLVYDVFVGKKAYLVVASNPRGGFNVNTVERDVPVWIAKKFSGRQLTSKLLTEKSGLPRFTALNALYVAVALRLAKKLKKRDGRSIVFKIR